MKRKKFVLLMLVFLLTLAGCGRAPQAGSSSSAAAETVTVEQMEETFGMPVVKVMTDLTNDDMGWKADHLHKTLMSMPGFEKDFMIYEEQIPQDGADRDNAITRVKTEIMAGKGPDLFLCTQDAYAFCGYSYGGLHTPFFTFPEKAMKNHLFLPLDDYIANAEYMEWDKFLPVVMEAGRNEEGQQIIPMSYFFEAAYVDKEKYGLEDLARPSSWQEMAQSGNPALMYASGCPTQTFVGRVMEPGADEPQFTEEELLGYMQEQNERISLVRGKIDEVVEDDTAYSGGLVRACFFDYNHPWNLGVGSPDYRIIPARNVNGGVTADISAFAAINRNARYPDLAFNIIDFLMSVDNQRSSALFRSRLTLGMPVHMDLGGKEYPLAAGESTYYMSEANFTEYCTARDEITEARFPGPVDEAVRDINIDPGSLKSSVHEQYMFIKMLLAES